MGSQFLGQLILWRVRQEKQTERERETEQISDFAEIVDFRNSLLIGNKYLQRVRNERRVGKRRGGEYPSNHVIHVRKREDLEGGEG